MSAVVVDLKIKIRDTTQNDDNETDPQYFIKTISMYKGLKGQTEHDEYDQYLSAFRGRTNIKSIYTMEHAVDLINKSNKILVLTGAGISVSAGIPDFRSENGLYSQIKDKFPDLTEPEYMFDMKYFLKNPNIFYSFADNICPGFDNQSIKFYPTSTHFFIKLLETKQKLLMNYTQNIDTLETIANIKNVIQCHGSFVTASCVNCEWKIKGHHIKAHLSQNRIPFCPYCCKSKSDLKYLLTNNTDQQLRKSQPILELFDAVNYKLRMKLPNVLAKDLTMLFDICPQLFLYKDDVFKINVYDADALESDKNKKCQCYTLEVIAINNDYQMLYDCMQRILAGIKNMKSFGVIKPDIVFFEQDLPNHYHEMIEKHTKECDLLIVMGTSLNVMPVSLVPSKLPQNVPAILINKEIPTQIINDQFDINLLGNCDDIVQTLINKLNWKSIQPKIKVNGDGNNDNNSDDKEGKEEIDGIDIVLQDAKATKYEFVKPNCCLFPNGKLPEMVFDDDMNEDIDIEDDKAVKSCHECDDGKDNVKIKNDIISDMNEKDDKNSDNKKRTFIEMSNSSSNEISTVSKKQKTT